jgi:ABC-2 type transport system permease protein
MTFRANFVITLLTRAFWFAAQLTLFEIIYRNVPTINEWSREEYFAFMATAMLINSVVETFFMPNCANFSELIRTGNLDFALLKPIDTQFLVSFEKMDLAMLNQILLAGGLLVYSLYRIGNPIGLGQVAMYLMLIGVGVTFLYSLMIALASTSIWFGRNQGLYDFWFYVTVFARYPRTIYTDGSVVGSLLLFAFTYVIPILLVVTVPARELMGKFDGGQWSTWFTLMGPMAAVAGLLISRAIFRLSLKSYRSASS